jgi:predicted transcriptional regulator
MNKAPIFYSVLLSPALSERRKDVNTVTWLPSIAMAGSVLLRERSRGMDAMQLLVTTIIRSSASQVW